jgi:hypothetical protein
MASRSRDSKGKFINQGNLVTGDIFIPNHSGMLDAGKVHRTPTDDLDPVNKKYVDDEVAGGGGGPVEGTAVLSTGEAGGTKFLREDGDGTSSWQTPGGGGDMLVATYDPASITEQLVGLIATQTLTGKTLDDFSNHIEADEIHEELRNESGATMNRGDAVFISGFSVGETRALVTLADNDSSATMPSVAILEDATLANNATGHFIETGNLSNIDTNSWEVGDEAHRGGINSKGSSSFKETCK